MAKAYADGFSPEYREIARDAFLCGYEAKCDSEKLNIKDLDEAARNYTDSSEWAIGENLDHIDKAFKAGAEWRDAQIPNTPEGLDEAAEKADNNGIVGFECGFSITKKHPRDYFKDGVEWVCGQGVTFDAEMKWYDGLLLFSEDERQFLTSSCFNEGDKVVVQVRKK